MAMGAEVTRTGPSELRTGVRDRGLVRIIPFDHSVGFELTGRIGQLHEDVVNVGVEGVFIAVAIGYGLEADTARPVPLLGDGAVLADVTLGDVPAFALMDGLRVNPAIDPVLFPGGRLDGSLARETANRYQAFQRIDPTDQSAGFSFLYNVVDTGTGRELQNAPVQNVAGLGEGTGERPFRVLARPLAFLPRSSFRVQVEERSEGRRGRLHMAFHGYKILGAAGVSEEHLRTLQHHAMQQYDPRLAATRTIRRVEAGSLASGRVVPFDYVARLEMEGRPGAIQETQVNVNVDGGYVATSIGYSLDVSRSPTQVELPELLDVPEGDPVPVGGLHLARIPSDFLREGFRIRPSALRLAFANGTLSALPKPVVARLFEPLNIPERVEFEYAIQDTGTGRSWQTRPVFNVAGLGSADGDRPFRHLAWPMHFLPRSTIRIRVREIFGRGRLYIVFHGYKTLGRL